MALENFAAASVNAVARLLSSRVNQYPSALAFAGKVGDSLIPRRRRAPKNQPRPGATAAANDATLQRKALIRPTRRTPSQSSNTPQGICISAYVQLKELERYPNATNDKPNESCNASRETDRLIRSKKLTRTPKASRKAIRHRRRGMRELLETVCSKIGIEPYVYLDTSLISARRLSSESRKNVIHKSCVGIFAIKCGSSSKRTPLSFSLPYAT